MAEYKTYIHALPNGVITGKFIGLCDDSKKLPNPKYKIEVKTDAQRTLLSTAGTEKVLWNPKARSIVRKREVKLIANKAAARADEKDTITISTANIPEDVKEITIKVNGEKVKLARGEDLTIDSDTAQTLYVEIEDELLLSNRLALDFTNPPVR